MSPMTMTAAPIRLPTNSRDRSVPSPRRWPYGTRTDGAKALGDGEAHGNRLGPDLNQEDLADG
jgi:hypothetical protein